MALWTPRRWYEMADVFEKITGKIIELLEAGTVPWRQPWSGAVPTNLSSMKPYNGINFLLLGCLGYESNFWVTFRQAQKLGGGVKAGAKSPAFVVYADNWETKKKRSDGTEEVVIRRFLKYTPVFNLYQCRGIESPEWEERDIEPLSACTAFMERLKEQPRIETGQLAAYVPSDDRIIMPAMKHFRDAESYHASLFHELTHWTGAAHRLARPLIHFTSDKKSYAREELVAEMGAAFLCAKCHIDTATIDNHAAYIDSWLQALRNDRRLVSEAAKSARMAVEFLESGAARVS